MTAHRLQRSFKARAEGLALKVRAELGIGPHERLDPKRLAAHLNTKVVGLSLLIAHGASEESVLHFHTAGQSDFSAVTVFRDGRPIIIVNEVHSEGRQANSLAHELSHLLLKHPPHRAVAENGCRLSFTPQEREADYLASVLLVPREGALHAARQGLSLRVAAAQFGVSESLMQWRFNDTHALKREEGAFARQPEGGRVGGMRGRK
jgi:Zn-dependent peptidase ImmA (M78 family)